MKKSYPGISIIIIIFVLISFIPLYDSIDTCRYTVSLNHLEGDTMPPVVTLQWLSPNGELPGTYSEYLARHPCTSPQFSPPLNHQSSTQFSFDDISILVDSALYPKIATSLNSYEADLESEGYKVLIQTVNGGSPQDIKTWIQNRYEKGSTGFILIGDITAAWVEISEEIFPSDLFYMDLDGTWEDTDKDGDYDSHASGEGDMGPDVYVARINAHTLTYDTEATLVDGYLNKTHAYREDALSQLWHGLEYIDEDWYTMPVNLANIYGENVSRYDQGYYTTAPDYLEKMDSGHHFVTVCAHSYSGGHHFGTRPTDSAVYTNIYVHSPTDRTAKLLLGSDDGIKVWLNGDNIYTNDRYGDWHKDYYTVDVTLRSGWNQLLCKISQGGGDFKVSARFTDQNLETFNDLEYQMSNPATHDQEAEYIRSWLLNGFYQDSSDRFWDYLTTNYLNVNEETLTPSEGEVTGGKTWTRYDSGYPYVNLNDYNDDADYGVCYAFTRIYSEKDTTCQLWMGYDDGARVWLNGNVVIYDNRYGGLEVDMTKVNISLTAGENTLLVKVSEWMGDQGFTARICQPDGQPVDGLTYDPPMTPVSWIGTWLVNGPYLNLDEDTRLTTDYLEGENLLMPSVGDPASMGEWERFIGDGCPVNLGGFYDHGDWVLSSDIQERDPPALFYNLFACGPGRFTDENYLAGAYIFHTSSGLITVASAKSGSMLNFDDFTRPLAEGKSIGEAFREWLDDQAPYQKWEQEWYYGMVICGDPTLCISPPARIDITKPGKALYWNNKEIIPFFVPVIIGDIAIEAEPRNLDNLQRVEFFVDDALTATMTTPPFRWTWTIDTLFPVRHTLKVVAYTDSEKQVTESVQVWRFQ